MVLSGADADQRAGEYTDFMTDSCTIDDLGPLPVLRPAAVGDLQDAVRRAAAERQAIYPLGGRTMLDLGLPPSRPGRAVDVTGLDQVIDYPARDMTVTVQAGITVAKLQDMLRGENQRLPIDVPHAERATLGGILACNVSGPRRLGFGTLRDYLIGISVVNDEGQEVKAGGRVVKNVAGYDLCKLHIGALGTLGVIAQVTLKLKPLPEEHALLALGVHTEDLGTLLERLHQSRTRPVCVELLNAAAVRTLGVEVPSAPWNVVVGFEDNREAVTWQVKQLIEELAAGKALGVETRVGAAATPLWQALVETRGRSDIRVAFQANLLASAVAAFCRHAESAAEGVQLQAHAGNGIVRGSFDHEPTRERVQAMLDPLRQSARAAQGNLIIAKCPADWKRTLPVWGEPRGDLWLMKTVKQKLDPAEIFNPGRLW